MSSSADIAAYALQQRQRIEELLTRRKPAWWRIERRWREAGEPSGLHSPDTGDPEFGRDLRLFLRLVGDAEELHDRAARAPDEMTRAVLARVEELRERITLPTEVPLTLELLLARRFELHRLLIELGDRTYLAGWLADLYDEMEWGANWTWRGLYGDERPALLPGEVPEGAAVPWGIAGVPEGAAVPWSVAGAPEGAAFHPAAVSDVDHRADRRRSGEGWHDRTRSGPGAVVRAAADPEASQSGRGGWRLAGTDGHAHRSARSPSSRRFMIARPALARPARLSSAAHGQGW